MLCQLEIPDEVVLAAAATASFVALNAAPARPIDLEPDLLVVNRSSTRSSRAAGSSRSRSAPRARRSRGRPRGRARGAAAP